MPIPLQSFRAKGTITTQLFEDGKLIEETSTSNRIVYIARALNSGLICNQTRPIKFADNFVPEIPPGLPQCNITPPAGTDTWFFPAKMCWSHNVPSGVVPTEYSRDLDGDILKSALPNRWAPVTYSFPTDYAIEFESSIGAPGSGAALEVNVGAGITIEEEGLFGLSPSNIGGSIVHHFLYAIGKGSWSLGVGAMRTFTHKIEF